MARGPASRSLNRWVSALMPVLIAALLAYASYVFIFRVAVLYLLRRQNRRGAAIAVLVVYSLLLLLLAIAYLRTAVTITVNPGYVPQGPRQEKSKLDEKDSLRPDSVGIPLSERSPPSTAPHPDDQYLDGATSLSDILATGPQQSTAPSQSNLGPPILPPTARSSDVCRTSTNARKRDSTSTTTTGGPPYAGPLRPGDEAALKPLNLGEFMEKEIYVCEADGLPRYCAVCNCWKPDRSHHCSEVNRCVVRMDHFCPWVGGVVGETSYKYFYQVVFYGAAYCIFLLITMAIFVAEVRSNPSISLDPQWIAILAMAAVFGIFSAGMAGSTSQLISRNITTIDSLSASTKIHLLAIHDPLPPPRPSLSGPVFPPRVWLPLDAPPMQKKCYVVVKTEPGENPWRLDGVLENWREVLGANIWMWGLPWGGGRMSNGGEMGRYRWNEKVVERLKREAGIGGGTR